MTPTKKRIPTGHAMLLPSAFSCNNLFFFLAIGVLTLLCLGCSNTEGEANSSSKNSDAGSASKPVAASDAGNAAAPKPGSTVDSNNAPDKTPKKIVVSTEPDINEPEFHELLIEASKDYLYFGMVNSVALPAPAACAPADSGTPKPFMSESEHESSHGKKLYFLFAKEIGHYVTPKGTPAPVGQVVVKEAWTSSPSNPAARNLVKHASGNRVNPRATFGDQTLEIGQRQNFFVMAKLAKDTPKTDQGWVYGVVDSDTREVLASGKVASCMSCHTTAANDRLFGSKHVKFEEKTTSPEEPK